MEFFRASVSGPLPRKIFVGSIPGVCLFLSGCVSGPAQEDSDPAETARVVGEHRAEEWTTTEEFSSYPHLVIQTKVSDERVVSAPLVQEDGSSFSGFGGKVVGFPASLRIENKDVIAAEILELDIWRRPAGRFGSYDSFVGADPIVLQAGESWEGSFVVSRRVGWYRLKVRPAAPDGWEAVHGSDLRNVFFQYGEGESADQLQFVFWNLGEDVASLQYWVADGIPSGIPDDFTASGTLTLAPGDQEAVGAQKPRGDWALVTKRMTAKE